MVCLNSRGTPSDGGGGSTSNRRNNRRSISQSRDLGQSRARNLGRHRSLGRHRDLEPVPRRHRLLLRHRWWQARRFPPGPLLPTTVVGRSAFYLPSLSSKPPSWATRETSPPSSCLWQYLRSRQPCTTSKRPDVSWASALPASSPPTAPAPPSSCVGWRGRCCYPQSRYAGHTENLRSNVPECVGQDHSEHGQATDDEARVSGETRPSLRRQGCLLRGWTADEQLWPANTAIASILF